MTPEARSVLDELTVRGFGIIEAITWRPGPGLNIITGETGAGKSLVVDAVEALLSGQVKEEDIRHGEAAARVEGAFSLPSGEAGAALEEVLEARGLGEEDGGLLLSCDFRRAGRTVPRVNGQAVSRSVLQEIGGALVDIHGQSEHLSLLRREHHLDILDAFAHTLDTRRRFGDKVAELHRLEREIASLSRDDRETARQLELLNFQIDEIDRAGLSESEEEDLRNELAVLTSAEKLKQAAAEVYEALYGRDGLPDGTSAIDQLNRALPQLRAIAETDAAVQPLLGTLEDAVLGLQELARDVSSYGDKLNDDPGRLEEVQGRLELIRSLKRKYGDSITGILSYAERATRERDGLTDSGARREELVRERESRREELGKMAGELSKKRTVAAEGLAEAAARELSELGMGRVAFNVSIARRLDENGLPFPGEGTAAYSAGGADEVTFLASTNPGEPLKPLEKIASTGEISRFLLALKSALAEADVTPVLIFDEIDIGVGGRSGEVIGRKLWGLSRRHQVICVTHLPQIAAYADAHFTVSKREDGGRTVSTIAPLEGDARVTELAAMITGQKVTETSLSAARELREEAAAWKETEAPA
jgi:DNA repair protein RecN (Recombination protein N)